MTATLEFFRVGNGDMTLVTFESGRTLLIDCRIRKAADDPNDDTPDVAAQLKKRLKRDDQDRPCVDAMLLSHPDQDHCTGLSTHFHMGSPGTYPTNSDKIVIGEQWYSPIVFRRAHKKLHVLCSDADAWSVEARRRVRLYETQGWANHGDRIRILGEDENGKTNKLGAILTKAGETLATINGQVQTCWEAFLLAPRPNDGDDAEEEVLSKNDSSVIMKFTFKTTFGAAACRFLTGGDAGVAIWERLWDRYGADATAKLGYDLLLSPHHCSWHSLSYDSWSQKGEEAKVSEKARSALGQAFAGATIVASSKVISANDADPPCIRAKREYLAILSPVKGAFTCVADDGPEPLCYEVVSGGVRLRGKGGAIASVGGGIGSKPVAHGGGDGPVRG